MPAPDRHHAVRVALSALCLLLATSLPGLALACEKTVRWANDPPYDMRGEDVRWYELSARGFTLQRTPLDVSKPLRQYRERSRAAWIFTSATLAVAGQFQHLARKLGLWEPRTLLEPSPFDWTTQALAYLRENGCDYIQGYYYSRPLPLSALRDWLAARRPLTAGATIA